MVRQVVKVRFWLEVGICVKVGVYCECLISSHIYIIYGLRSKVSIVVTITFISFSMVWIFLRVHLYIDTIFSQSLCGVSWSVCFLPLNFSCRSRKPWAIVYCSLLANYYLGLFGRSLVAVTIYSVLGWCCRLTRIRIGWRDIARSSGTWARRCALWFVVRFYNNIY